jgi:hypothetical protein
MGFASRVGAQLSQRHIMVRGIVRTGMSPQASKLELSLMPGLPRYLLVTYSHPSSLHLVHLMNVVVRKPTVTHLFTHTKHSHMARGHKLHDVRPLTTHEILADQSHGIIMKWMPPPEIVPAAEVVASWGPPMRASSC